MTSHNSWALLRERYRGVYQSLAEKHGFLYEELDADGYLLRIHGQGKSTIVPFTGWASLNTHGAIRIARDKALTRMLLARENVALPKGTHFFLKGKGDWEPEEGSRQDAYAYATALGYPVFVKPHNQSQGRGARIVHSEQELTIALDVVRELSHAVMIEEYIQAREGRIMCIDGEVQCMYYKVADAHTGVGNLSAGGTLVDFRTKDIPESLVVLGRRCYDAFAHDLRLYAIDFFQTKSGEVLVIEVNGNPAMTRAWDAGYSTEMTAMIEHALLCALTNERPDTVYLKMPLPQKDVLEL